MRTLFVKMKSKVATKLKAYSMLFLKLTIISIVLWYIRDYFDVKLFHLIISNKMICAIMPLAWLGNQLLTSKRLGILLQAVDQKSDNLLKLFRLNLISMLFTVLPLGLVGSDIAKIVMLSHYHKNISKKKLAFIVLCDRILGLVSLIVAVSFISIIVRSDLIVIKTIQMSSWLLSLLLLFVLICVYIASKKIMNFKREKNDLINTMLLLLQFIVSTFTNPRAVIKLGAISMLAILVLVFSQAFIGYWLLELMQSNGHFWQQAFALPASIFAAIVPITPVGIGLGQISVVSLYELLNIPSTVGVVVVSLSQISQILLAITLGGYYFFRESWVQKQPQELNLDVAH